MTLKLTYGMLHVWYIAAVRKIGFSKELFLDHSTHLGSELSTYPPNFVKISLSGAEIAPKTKFERNPRVAEVYFRLQF